MSSLNNLSGQTATDRESRVRAQKLRYALLGAAAVIAVGGVSGYSNLSPMFSGPNAAYAQAPLTAPSFADVVDQVRGAVVSVKVKVVDNDGVVTSRPGLPQFEPGDPLERFFRQFGEGRNGQQSPQARPRSGISQGSGFVISADGYVVTNNHVVDKASEVTLTFDDGKTVTATIVGTDPKTDLALLKIKEAGTYKFVEFAPKAPRVGEWVIAVGNPFGLGGTVTAGIVSARGRDIGSGPYDDYLQIDAPVNRGNSGGPTFNAQGQVVGVNTAIYSPSGGSVGIGFAIPSEVAKDVIASLQDKGSVARGWLGVQIQPVTPEIADSLSLKGAKGALVADAQKDSPAAASGLRAGDVITHVNGDAIESPRELSRKIAGFGPDRKVDVTVVREGAEKTLSVKLGNMPNEQRADARPQRDNQRGDALTGYGMTLAPASQVAGAGRQGVVVADINPEGPAAQKGLRAGDVIVEAAGQPVSRPADVSRALEQAKKDGRKAVLLRVRSADSTRFVALALS
jgi:serine protease Do